jgi:hypothetical protein
MSHTHPEHSSLMNNRKPDPASSEEHELDWSDRDFTDPDDVTEVEKRYIGNVFHSFAKHKLLIQIFEGAGFQVSTVAKHLTSDMWRLELRRGTSGLSIHYKNSVRQLKALLRAHGIYREIQELKTAQTEDGIHLSLKWEMGFAGTMKKGNDGQFECVWFDEPSL